MTEWKQAAQAEQAQWIEDQAEGFNLYGPKRAWKQNLSQRRYGPKGGPPRHRDPDAMDVDLTRVGQMMDKKKKKLAAEG